VSVGLKFLLTCNPGTEDVVAVEVREEVPGARVLEARSGSGRVKIESPQDPGVLEKILGLRSVHSVALLLAEGPVGFSMEGLKRAYGMVAEARIEEFFGRGYTFAVESERVGEGHEYTSMDIARVVGEAVIRVVEERRGWRPEVRLNSPHVIVYSEVYDDTLSIGVLLSGERSLHIKRYRVYDHPAALKHTLAYVMLRLSGARDGEVILDPMCGGGTIAVEAALLYENSRITCMDINPRYLKGALANIMTARVEGRVRVIVGDARRLTEYAGVERVDRIITNPPYGIRMGELEEARSIIRDFIPEAYKVLKHGGTLTVITPDIEYLLREARKTEFTVKHLRAVKHGDLHTSIAVLEKLTHTTYS